MHNLIETALLDDLLLEIGALGKVKAFDLLVASCPNGFFAAVFHGLIFFPILNLLRKKGLVDIDQTRLPDYSEYDEYDIYYMVSKRGQLRIDFLISYADKDEDCQS